MENNFLYIYTFEVNIENIVIFLENDFLENIF